MFFLFKTKHTVFFYFKQFFLFKTCFKLGLNRSIKPVEISIMLLYFYARPLGMRTAQLYAILQCKLRNYRNLDFLLFSRVIL
jgi:hypothetical protein